MPLASAPLPPHTPAFELLVILSLQSGSPGFLLLYAAALDRPMSAPSSDYSPANLLAMHPDDAKKVAFYHDPFKSSTKIAIALLNTGPIGFTGRDGAEHGARAMTFAGFDIVMINELETHEVVIVERVVEQSFGRLLNVGSHLVASVLPSAVKGGAAEMQRRRRKAASLLLRRHAGETWKDLADEVQLLSAKDLARVQVHLPTFSQYPSLTLVRDDSAVL